MRYIHANKIPHRYTNVNLQQKHDEGKIVKQQRF